MSVSESPDARAPREPDAELLPLSRAFLIAIGIEVAVLAGVLVNWQALMPDPEPEPMKVEFVKLPEPPPPPPKEEPPPPDLPPPDKKAPPVKKVTPHYPKDALSQGIEGKVRIRLTVSPAGKVLKTEVLDSTPPGVFDYAAETAAKKYIFPPGDEQFEIDQPFEFKIEDDRYGPDVKAQ